MLESGREDWAMVMRAEFRQALLVGVVVAIVGGLVWFLEEPIFTLGAVMRSAALALLVLLAWSGAWAWWIHDDEVQQRELRRPLKRIDRAGYERAALTGWPASPRTWRRRGRLCCS